MRKIDLLWGICRDIGVRTRDWIEGGWVGLSVGGMRMVERGDGTESYLGRMSELVISIHDRGLTSNTRYYA